MSKTKYQVGMVVEHKLAPNLGRGIIVNIDGGTITIQYEQSGLIKYDSSIAPFKILPIKHVDYFAKPDKIHSLKELHNYSFSSSPCVYAWYFYELPPYVPKTGCTVIKTGTWPFRKNLYLLYIGKASSFKERVLGEHFQGNYVRGQSISSLRLTLGCLLYKKLGIFLHKHPDFPNKDYTFGDKGNQKLSSWMAEKARVTWVETAYPDDFERRAIQYHVLPLNTDDNSESFEAISFLRKEFRRIAKNEKPNKRDYKKAYQYFMSLAKR